MLRSHWLSFALAALASLAAAPASAFPPVATSDSVVLLRGETVNFDPRINDSPGVQFFPFFASGFAICEVTNGPDDGSETHSTATITYAPDPGFNGEDNLRYRLEIFGPAPCSGEVSNQARVVLVVNAVPEVANPVGTLTVAEDAPQFGVALDDVFGDDDVGNGGAFPDALTYTVTANSNPGLFTSASVQGSDLVFELLPEASGSATITVRAQDNRHALPVTHNFVTASENFVDHTFTVVVEPVNDAPVAVDDSATTPEDSAVTVAATGNDTDVDGGTLAVTAATSGDGTTAIAGGNVTFTPTADFNGTATITYTVDDGAGGTDTGSVTVTVTAVPDAPVVAAQIADVSVLEDAANATVNAAAAFSDGDVPYGDVLTYAITGNSNAALFTTASINPGTGVVTLDFAPDASGTATLTVRAQDTTGQQASDSFDVVVAPVNDTPVAVDDTATTPEDTAVTIDVLANDTDVEAGALVLQAVSPASGTASIVANRLSFTPAANQHGTVDVGYTVRDVDGGTDTGNVVVTVTAVNDAPAVTAPLPDLAVDEDAAPVTVSAAAAFTDPDVATAGDVLSYAITGNSNPSLVTATIVPATGVVTLAFAANRSGASTIDVRATDLAGESATDTFVVTVSGGDDQPVAAGDSATTAEDQPVTIAVLANDFTEDAPVAITRAGITITIDGVEYTNASESSPTSVTDLLGNEVTAPNGTLTGSDVDGTITYTPKADFFGEDFFSYEITDANGDTSVATVTVTVTPVNDAPVGDSLFEYTIIENTFLSVPAPGLLFGARDADPDDTLRVVLQTPPSHGTLGLEPDGSFLYVPDVDFVGADTFTFFVNDGTENNEDGVYTVQVTVDEAPPAPPPPPPGEVQANFQLSDVPLELAVGVEPNVLVIMDDSGSMDWTLMTRESEGRFRISTSGLVAAANARTITASYLQPLASNVHGQATTSDGATSSIGEPVPSQEAIDGNAQMTGNNFGTWRVRNASYNKIYYNPRFQYLPWRGLDAGNQPFADASPTAARLDPLQAATINLLTPVTWTNQGVPVLTGTGSTGACTVFFGITICSPPAGIALTTTDYYIPRYYRTAADDTADPDDFPAFDAARTLVEIRDNCPVGTPACYTGGAGRADCAVDDGDPATCTYAQEIQNFANWFTYYRSREYTAKNALGRVVADLDAIRVGYAAINDTADRLAIARLGVSVQAGTKRSLLDQIYRIDSNGGTPLRGALDRAGRHFECTSGDAFGSTASSLPGAAGCPVAASPAGACQQNYALLFTDGNWNGDAGFSTTNRDGPGDGDSNFDGGVYADGVGGTLADVAMHYYERDLHATLANNVATTDRDRGGALPGAFGGDDSTMHQHMASYMIGFGVDGLLDDGDIPGDITTPLAWGDPFSSEIVKIDDLRHAALNGRGSYLSAGDPESTNTALTQVFEEFSTGEGAASAVAFNSQEIQQDTLLFRGFYNTLNNTGDLVAQELDSNGQVVDPPVWSAAAVLDDKAPNDRVIVTFDPATREGIPFRFASLTAAQKAPGAGLLTANMVDYFRGVRANERPNGDNLRERPATAGLLGDIVHSTPVFIGEPPFIGRDREAFPTSDLYSAFKAANADRTSLVHVASNEGMLHGFRADTGEEVYAYVPDKLIGGERYANPLYQLASPGYSHRFFNDLSPALNDVYITPPGGVVREWRTLLLGGLRGGGKGYYALDVTDPDDFATEAAAANHVLWEFTDADDDYPVDAAGDPLGGAVGALLDLNGEPIKDLGYAYSEPTTAMSNARHGGSPASQKWMAAFGNGYNSTSGIAKLFVLFIEDGIGGWDAGDVVKIDTGFGVPEAGEPNEGLPNALGAPRLVDADGNGTADYAYAGDLLGNFYRFDLTSDDPADWTSTRIFRATYHNGTPADDSDDIQQPITSQPIVIRNPQSDEGFIVIFATGSFVTVDDGTSTEIQSIYGIWDRLESGGTADLIDDPRSLLVEQPLVNVVDPDQGSLRIASASGVDYNPPSTSRGWVIDLDLVRAATDTEGDPNTDTAGNDPPDVQFPGERAIRNLQLRGGFLFVNTVIPREANNCLLTPGGFALALNPATGGQGGLRETIAFDLDNDGEFDENDLVGGSPVAGIRFDDAVPTDSSFIGSKRYTQLSNREIDVRETNTSTGTRTGRLSWQELD
jgi:type IV pilus assembly protein PilY1